MCWVKGWFSGYLNIDSWYICAYLGIPNELIFNFVINGDVANLPDKMFKSKIIDTRIGNLVICVGRP